MIISGLQLGDTGIRKASSAAAGMMLVRDSLIVRPLEATTSLHLLVTLRNINKPRSGTDIQSVNGRRMQGLLPHGVIAKGYLRYNAGPAKPRGLYPKAQSEHASLSNPGLVRS